MRWKTPLPPGHSSPVLTDSHIFLTAHTPDKDAYKLLVIALDRKTGKRAVAARGAARADRAPRERQRSGVAEPGDRRRQRLCVLPGLRADQLHRRRQGAVAHAARAVQHVLRLRRVADSRRRHADPAASIRTRTPYLLARRCEDRQASAGRRRSRTSSPATRRRRSIVRRRAARRSSCPSRSSSPPTRSPTASRCGGCAASRAR